MPSAGDAGANGAADPAAAGALDANFGALLAWYASWSGGEIERSGDLLLTSSGVRFRAINTAALADLDPARAASRIDDAVDWLSARTDRWRWLVGPTSRPLDLEARLVNAGLTLISDTPGMALDLGGWETGIEPPAGVAIEPVVDDAGLERWRDVQRRGLSLDDESAEAWWLAHRHPGVGQGSPHTIWIASLDGAPVAAAALFVGAGVAGIYNVCTVPDARGRGIGGAVTGAALDAGAVLGLPIAVLGSSEMGYPVYRRLAFREVSRLRSYTRVAG